MHLQSVCHSSTYACAPTNSVISKYMYSTLNPSVISAKKLKMVKSELYKYISAPMKLRSGLSQPHSELRNPNNLASLTHDLNQL